MRVAVVGHVEWVDFMRVDRVPSAGEIVHGSEWWSEPGGGGPGAAVQLRKLAGSCDFFTALGDDEIGHRAHEALRALGLQVHAAWRPEPQRRAVVHIDRTGERTITVLGSRSGPRGDDALPWEILDGADAVYFTAGDAGALAHVRRARVVVATSRALEILQKAGQAVEALVGSADDPAERYAAGGLVPDPPLIVRTEAERGGTLTTADGTRRYQAVPAPARIVDAYGCGDSFAGALTFALGGAARPDDAVALAARCGAAVLAGRGPYSAQLTASDLA